MKFSKLILTTVILSQIAGVSAHATDDETMKKALEWVKANHPEDKDQSGPSEDSATQKAAQAAADNAKKQAQIAAQKKVEAEKQAQIDAAKNAQAQTSSKKTTLDYATVVNIADYKGTTFFSLMQNTIKPALDQYANQGYRIANGDQMEKALKLVDSKVASNALSAAGSMDRLKKISNALAATGQRYSFHQLQSEQKDPSDPTGKKRLPGEIAKVGGSAGEFDLTKIFGLLSGGGVAVRIDDGVYAYNVNYGDGTVTMDAQSGRSFGEAAGRLARDASDADYLQALERYVRKSGGNVEKFYRSILEILTNNDPGTYREISDEGKVIAADFLAVYVAEQDRHLMVHLQSQHWDRALLEVTLISAFHAGQSQIQVMYNDQLTATTYKQVRNCQDDPNTPLPPKVPKAAGMLDYWQFSTQTTQPNCVRSGINLTNNQFRKLGQLITSYERQHNPDLVSDIESHLKSVVSLSGNVFADLSLFFANYSTPKSLDSQTLRLASDFTRFLMQVRADADAITADILANQQVSTAPASAAGQ